MPLTEKTIDETIFFRKVEQLFVFDNDFQELVKLSQKSKANIFDILGIKTNEVKISRFLAWLLNPNESHELDDLFLKKLLIRILRDNQDYIKDIVSYSFPTILDIDLIDLHDATVISEDFLKSGRRIDISIEIKNLLLISIENKIFSVEGTKQTEDYANEKIAIAKTRKLKLLLIFLTPEGYSPESVEFIPASYQVIVDVIGDILRDPINSKTASLLTDFKHIIEENIIMNENVKIKSRALYTKYRDVLDTIFNCAPTPASFLQDLADHITKTSSDYRTRAGNSWMTCCHKKWLESSQIGIKNYSSVRIEVWLDSENLSIQYVYPCKVDALQKIKGDFLSDFEKELRLKGVQRIKSWGNYCYRKITRENYDLIDIVESWESEIQSIANEVLENCAILDSFLDQHGMI